MKKYLITILNLKTYTNAVYTRDERDIDLFMTSKLGGWSNINISMTSRPDIDHDNYTMSGTTKDGGLAYSILCYYQNY